MSEMGQLGEGRVFDSSARITRCKESDKADGLKATSHTLCGDAHSLLLLQSGSL